MGKLLRSPSGLIGILLVSCLILLAIFGPIMWGAEATRIDATQILQGSSSTHPLGTDTLGRDVLARVLTATRLSLVLALLATIVGVGVGIPWGLLPVALPARAARFVAGSINTLVGFPGVLLAMFTSVVMGLGGRGAVLGIGVAIAPVMARLTHNLASSVANSDYVAAAKVLNVPRRQIVTRHIAPNIAEPLILNVTLIMGGSLLGLAALSFLGLGVQAPSNDWGRMLTEGLARIYVDPAVALGPAAAITLAGVGFNLLGEGFARIASHEGPSSPRNEREPTATSASQQPAEAWDDPPAISGDVLEFHHLTVTFGNHSPVRDVSLSVRSGEILGIVGESGSGKSLTALAIGGLVPYPGLVTMSRNSFAGVELSELSVSRRRKFLGVSLAMVFQDPLSSLNPVLKIGSQLAEVPRTHQGSSRSRAWRRAVEKLTEVGIPDPERRAGQRPHEFSGGMRQRAVIAMGMMGTPRLLIADEPTTALDVTIQRQILELLATVTARTQAGAVFISHDIAVVSQLCHRVVVMYAGRIVEELPVEDLESGAAHPYTRALIASLPNMQVDRQRELVTIPGSLPTAAQSLDDACAFAPRCTHATSVCFEQRPRLISTVDGGRLACWHPQSGAKAPGGDAVEDTA